MDVPNERIERHSSVPAQAAPSYSSKRLSALSQISRSFSQLGHIVFRYFYLIHKIYLAEIKILLGLKRPVHKACNWESLQMTKKRRHRVGCIPCAMTPLALG